MSPRAGAAPVPAPREPEPFSARVVADMEASRAQREGRAHGVTFGDWLTERESAAAFDAVVDTDLFDVHREVPGRLVQPRPDQVDKGLRIDRLLVPTGKLVDAGWQHGAVGVEIKRSGISIGPPIAQAMDYSRAVWDVDFGGIQVWLGYVFIWPMPKQSGVTASILAQHRIGSATSSAHAYPSAPRLQFKSGETPILRVYADGSVDVGEGRAGRRTGTR